MKPIFNTYSIFLILMMLSRIIYAQTPTTQDCLGAIPVCDFIYVEDQTASGYGNYNEIPATQSCPSHCMDGEKNSRWYIFTVVQSGYLSFEITPQTPTDDYDWSVFNLTNNSCEEIWSNPAEMLVSCNAAGGPGYQGATGVSSLNGGTVNCNGGGATFKWNKDLLVWEGQTYALVVSDWTQTPGGYTLDFSASTATIFDDQRPYIEYVGGDLITGCGTNEILIRFNENVKCSSVQAGDFNIDGPGGPYNVVDCIGDNCELGGANEREYILTIEPAIYQGGDFTIGLTQFSSISDACNNYALASSFPFTVTLDTPEALAGDDISVPYASPATLQGDAAGGSGQYNYYWEPASLLVDPAMQNPTTVELTTSTAFTLLVTDAESGCQSQDTMWVIVVGGPLAINVSASAEEVCSGNRVDLMASTGGGSGEYQYLWSSNPPGLNSTLATPSVYPTENTWFKVEVTDGYSLLSDSIYVVVYPSPVADAGSDQVINEGTTTTLSGSASGGTPDYTFQWEPASWLEQNNVANPTTLPLYDPTIFSLIVTDMHGCPSEPSQVLINPDGGGLSAFPMAEPNEICKGESTTIQANPTGGGMTYTFEWTSSPSGFTSTESSFSVSPIVDTRYDLIVTDQFGNEYAAHTNVTVNQLPVISLAPDGSDADTIVVCVRDSVAMDAGFDDDPVNTEYYWLKNSYVNRYYTARSNGSWIEDQTHSVRVTDGTTGCVNTDSIYILFAFSECNIGIEETQGSLDQAISIFPNPNSGDFMLELNEPLSDVTLQVFDSRGAMIYEELLSGRMNLGYKKVVSLQGISPGIYIIRFQNQRGVSAQRMVVR